MTSCCNQEVNVNTLEKNATATTDQAKETAANYLLPRVDIVETKDAYRLEAEMPGVGKEGLEVLLDGAELTIIGRRTTASAGPEYLYRESKPLNYRRVFELDPAIDTANVDARIDQGILTLRLPKSERVKPRKIQVLE
jgi:HSP20 family protein